MDLTARDATADERQVYWRQLTNLPAGTRGYQDAAGPPHPLVVCEPGTTP